MRRLWVWGLVAVLTLALLGAGREVFLPAPAAAQGPLPCEKGVGGGYHVLFAAYQGELSQLGDVEYCDGVPKTGLTWLVFDLVDRPLRELPIGLRVIQKSEAGDVTITELPPQTYPHGVLSTQVNLPEKGEYLINLTVDRGFGLVSEFTYPLEVGSAGLSFQTVMGDIGWVVIASLLGALALGAFGFWRALRPPRRPMSTPSAPPGEAKKSPQQPKG